MNYSEEALKVYETADDKGNLKVFFNEEGVYSARYRGYDKLVAETFKVEHGAEFDFGMDWLKTLRFGHDIKHDGSVYDLKGKPMFPDDISEDPISQDAK